MQACRRDLQMIFQDPYASLNPRMTVYATLAEPLLVHGICPPAEVRGRVARAHEHRGPRPPLRAASTPTSSRAASASGSRSRAPSRCSPKIIVADEPVSALDVSIQAQILNLLSQLCREMNLTLIFIAHDLSVVRHISDRVAVMYLGKIVELGPAEDVIDRPTHPYTRALVSAIPVADPEVERSAPADRARGRPALARSTRRRAAPSIPAARTRSTAAGRPSRPSSPRARPARRPASASARSAAASARAPPPPASPGRRRA